MGRVKDNPAILYSGVASGDVFFITDIDIDTDKKIEAGEVKKYDMGLPIVTGKQIGRAHV